MLTFMVGFWVGVAFILAGLIAVADTARPTSLLWENSSSVSTFKFIDIQKQTETK